MLNVLLNWKLQHPSSGVELFQFVYNFKLISIFKLLCLWVKLIKNFKTCPQPLKTRATLNKNSRSLKIYFHFPKLLMTFQIPFKSWKLTLLINVKCNLTSIKKQNKPLATSSSRWAFLISATRSIYLLSSRSIALLFKQLPLLTINSPVAQRLEHLTSSLIVMDLNPIWDSVQTGFSLQFISSYCNCFVFSITCVPVIIWLCSCSIQFQSKPKNWLCSP